jgi:hypothetical protein
LFFFVHTLSHLFFVCFSIRTLTGASVQFTEQQLVKCLLLLMLLLLMMMKSISCKIYNSSHLTTVTG